MANLEIDAQPVEGRNNAAVVTLQGPLDGKHEQAMRAALEKLEKQGRVFAVLDMAKVSHADDKGLSALVMSADSCRAAGGGLVMINVPPSVRVLVDMLSLDGVLPTLGDPGSALEALEKEARRRAEAAPDGQPTRESGLFIALEDSSGRNPVVTPDDLDK